MDSCEQNQITISAFLDGEAGRQDMTTLLDHLAGCSDCRGFYRQSRQLQRLIETSDAALAGQCTESSGQTTRRVWLLSHLPKIPAWAWGAAALVIIALSLGSNTVLRKVESPILAGGDQPLTVTLGEDRGQMDDARFVEMTLELLRAESRYRQEMYAVLEQVEHGGEDPPPEEEPRGRLYF